MDKLERYRQHVQAVLSQYARYKPAYGEVEIEQVIDSQRDHYELLTVGWNKQQRIHGSLLHIDIKDGKLWIQHDGAEEGVANVLVDMGVPKDDIVLAFHAPYKRPFTGFATG